MKKFLFLPRMSLHFHLRNKKVLGRKATTFQPKKFVPTGKKKTRPTLLQKRGKSLCFLFGLYRPKKAEGLMMPLAKTPNLEEVGDTPREGNKEHREDDKKNPHNAQRR